MEIEARLKELGLELPGPTKTPPGLVLPFSWVRVRGDCAYVSGHVPLNPDGTVAGQFGKVGAEKRPTRRRGWPHWRSSPASRAP
jgi:hypothetical protein